MSFDLAFWGSGDGNPTQIYESVCSGDASPLHASEDVLNFREEVLRRWISFADFIEPLEYDPDVEEQADLDRYVLLTVPFSLVGEMRDVIKLAHSYGLTVYDPQSEQIVPVRGGDS